MQKILSEDNQKEGLGALAVILAALAGKFENEWVTLGVIVTIVAAWTARAYIKRKGG